jgi:DNA-binding GntR family transcriptional regulator
MTTAEHQVIIEMFKQQRMFYVGIVKLLQSREIASESDLQAFDALVVSEREVVEQQVTEDYLAIGKAFGVTIGPLRAT